MKGRFTENRFKETISDLRDSRLRAWENLPQEEHAFSSEFHERMERLRSGEPRRRTADSLVHWSKRVAAVALIFLLSTFVISMPVDAFIARFYEMCVQSNESMTHIFFRPIVEQKPEEGFIRYDFSGLSVDYYAQGQIYSSDKKRSESFYRTPEGDWISFIQQDILTADIVIETGDASVVPKIYDGTEYYCIDLDHAKTIIWFDNDYVFTLSAPMSFTSLFEMAQTVQPVAAMPTSAGKRGSCKQ